MIYIISAFSGFLGGLFGSGSGLLILPATIKFLKINEYKARGTTLAIALIVTIVSSIFYYKNNYFEFNIAGYLIFGGIVGGMLGAKLMLKISKFWLSITFYFFMIFIAIRMIF